MSRFSLPKKNHWCLGLRGEERCLSGRRTTANPCEEDGPNTLGKGSVSMVIFGVWLRSSRAHMPHWRSQRSNTAVNVFSNPCFQVNKLIKIRTIFFLHSVWDDVLNFFCPCNNNFKYLTILLNFFTTNIYFININNYTSLFKNFEYTYYI